MQNPILQMVGLCLLFANASHAQSFVVDSTFGNNGAAYEPLPLGSGEIDGIHGIGLADGSIATIGILVDGNHNNVAIEKFHVDGTRDTTFGTGGFRLGPDFAPYLGQQWGRLKALPDGRLMALCHKANNDSAGLVLFRLNTDGSFDSTFSDDGVLSYFPTHYCLSADLALQPDGKILAAGAPSTGCMLIDRFLPDGTPDPSFGTGGRTTLWWSIPIAVDRITVGDDGSIYLAGHAGGFLSSTQWLVAKLSSAGILDTSYGVNGFFNYDAYPDTAGWNSHYEAINAVIEDGTGGLYLAGTVTPGALYREQAAVAKVLPNGELDPTFGQGGLRMITTGADTTRAFGLQLILRPEGYMILLAASRNFNFGSNDELEMLLVNIALDGTVMDPSADGGLFPFIPPSPMSAVCDLVQQSDGRLLVVCDIAPSNISQTGLYAFRSSILASVPRIPEERMACSAYPVPSSGAITINYTLQRSGLVTINLLDVQGRYVHELAHHATQASGIQHESFELGGSAPNGSYIVQVATASERSFVKVILAR